MAVNEAVASLALVLYNVSWSEYRAAPGEISAPDIFCSTQTEKNREMSQRYSFAWGHLTSNLHKKIKDMKRA